MLHVTHDGPYSPGGRALIVGSDVTVGHRVVLHACTIGDACLVGMGSIVLDNVGHWKIFVMIGAGSVVASGQAAGSAAVCTSAVRRAACANSRSARSNFFTYSAAHYVRSRMNT